jgi:UDP-2,4-diacetamido-2,4,6-trideoxy-beta-L-altropyranose hydrolase
MTAPNMHVAIRADASQMIGSGHVMRCATLGRVLQNAGARVRFICRELPGHYAAWLRQHGFEVTLLPSPELLLPTGIGGYAQWLGVDVATDIRQCRAALEGQPLDWLIVDHYALDAQWECSVRPPQARMLVIDDLANRPHDCALLLDQNYHAAGAERYRELAPSAELLLGPDFSLLRPDFALQRGQIRQRSGAVHKLQVFLGGSDNANVSATVLKALVRCHDGLEVDVITGLANPHRDALEPLCAQIGAHLYVQVDDMAARMVSADLAIGATGAATWERAALGLPTLAVSVADNQRDIARHADALGLLRWLGDADTIGESDWVAAIEWARANPAALRAQSNAGMSTVDGSGAHRVMEHMYAHQHRLH